MVYDELIHCIRAVCTATGCHDLCMFGSQALLLRYGVLPGDAAEEMEADIMCEENTERYSYIIDGCFGDDTRFANEFGITVDGMLEKSIMVLPDWRERGEEYVINVGIGEQIDARVKIPSTSELAVSKLYAGREQDRRWLQAMYDAGLLDVQEMSCIIYRLPIPFEKAQHTESMLARIVAGNTSSWRVY